MATAARAAAAAAAAVAVATAAARSVVDTVQPGKSVADDRRSPSRGWCRWPPATAAGRAVTASAAASATVPPHGAPWAPAPPPFKTLPPRGPRLGRERPPTVRRPGWAESPPPDTFPVRAAVCRRGVAAGAADAAGRRGRGRLPPWGGGAQWRRGCARHTRGVGAAGASRTVWARLRQLDGQEGGGAAAAGRPRRRRRGDRRGQGGAALFFFRVSFFFFLQTAGPFPPPRVAATGAAAAVVAVAAAATVAAVTAGVVTACPRWGGRGGGGGVRLFHAASRCGGGGRLLGARKVGEGPARRHRPVVGRWKDSGPERGGGGRGGFACPTAARRRGPPHRATGRPRSTCMSVH